MKTGPSAPRQAAEALAIQALTFIAADGERLGHFLAVTGIGPAEIRGAAREPQFLAGVVEFLVSDNRLAAQFATEAGYSPADLAKAHAVLGGEPWERELP